MYSVPKIVEHLNDTAFKKGTDLSMVKDHEEEDAGEVQEKLIVPNRRFAGLKYALLHFLKTTR